MRNRDIRVFWILVIIAFSGPVSAQADRTKTDWMFDAKLGVSTHYTAGWKDLEKMAGLFDAGKIANQLEKAGAGWFLFTLHHQSWAMMAPNQAYDQITGTGKHRTLSILWFLQLYH